MEGFGAKLEARGRNMEKPSQEQMDALRAFARANGRTWKAALRDLWMNGVYNYAVMGDADSACLQQIRNTFEPTWLCRFRLGAPNA